MVAKKFSELFLTIIVSSFAFCSFSLQEVIAHHDTVNVRRTATTGRTIQKNDSLLRERNISRAQAIRELQLDIDGLLQAPELSNTHVGVSAQYVETGEYLYRREDDKNFTPASNVKLITTAAALEYLGKNFRFVTRFYLDGSSNRGGEFIGNIVIRGGGDPTLSQFFFRDPSFVFDAVYRKLDSLGIHSVRGNIIADDSYFADEPYPNGWAIEDIPYAFSPEISGLNYNDNLVEFVCEPGIAPGERPQVIILPENDYITYRNELTTTDSTIAPTAEAARGAESNEYSLVGGVPVRTDADNVIVQASVHEPSLYFASVFRGYLEDRGIKVRGSLLQSSEINYYPDYSSLLLMTENYSPPLAEIILITNRFSHNLCAEVLLKTIAKEKTGIGTFQKGIDLVKQYLIKNGIYTENTLLSDGSGLSRLNLFSPKNFVKLLSTMYHSQYRDEYIASLAIPGERGTLQKRMIKSRAETNIFAKTGGMTSVSTISGYALTRDREPVAFSIMMNGFTVPFSIVNSIQDLVCMRLASFSRK